MGARRPAPAGRALVELEALRLTYADGVSARRLELLGRLERGRLGSAQEVLRLHEALCFLRAYPDDAAVLARVENLLAGFAGRSDLRRHARSLVNSGIAGTVIDFRFYWFTASWLVRRWPDRLSIVWRDFDRQALLDSRLGLLATPVEQLALGEYGLSTREWIERLRGPDETDLAFLVRRFEALSVGAYLRESYYEELDVPCRLAPGPGTPSRTHARHAPSPVVFQRGPLVRSRRAFRAALRLPPRAVRAVPRRRAHALITLAREAMITRDRDLDAFVHADPDDVRLVEFGDGLQFACYGTVPAQRQLLDAVYGFLMLRNGVPLGYVLSAALFRSAEVAFNLFETYRGAEAAHLLGRSLSVVRRLFGADTFALDPYQLGHGNPEGLRSGAWWFYYKLGFRPKDAGTKRLVAVELRKLRADPGYRSSMATLQELSAANLFLHLGRQRRDVVGLVARENVGLRIVDELARRYGAERERGLRECAAEAARLLRTRARLAAGERLAWERWSPLVRILPGLERWSAASRAALVRVVRAKGGRRESDFVRLFDAHAPLRRAVLSLAR